MNAATWTALISTAGALMVAVIGWAVERNKRTAEISRLKAESAKLTEDAAAAKASADAAMMDAASRVAAAIQDRYQELLADVTAQANAATARAAQCEILAREAQQAAAESESQAWRAQQHARQMARFLVELRPVIAAHVPEAEAVGLLERIDRLSQLV